MVTLKEIQEAYKNIKPYIHKTPLIHSSSLSMMTGADVYIKTENLQKTGSFKVRGAFNRLINISGKRVIAASMGNHAQGVAYAANKLGLSAKIIMPLNAPIIKEEASKGYGAEVILHGDSFQDALDYALSQKEHIFIHAFDDEMIIAGQGTIGLEILEDLDNIGCILVPVGGGGLISGISAAVKALSPETRIIGVQTESARSALDSFRTGMISPSRPSSTIADGIAVEKIGAKTFEAINRYVDEIIAVSEDSIAKAIILYLERKKLVVEGAGAVPLAALLENRESFCRKRIVLIASGGNIDFTLVDRIIHKGLTTSERIGVFDVVVDDVPGSLHSLTGVIASHRGNILNVLHDRFAEELPIGKTKVTFTIETRGKEHLEDIISELSAMGYGTRNRIHPSE
jgi:threonine dehydratase